MRRENFDKLRNSIYSNQIVGLNNTKGKDYSGDDDAFANFKRNAERLDLSPSQVWAVYFMKHIDAIMSYIATGEAKSEPIEGRVDDAITYLFLLRGMLAEPEIDSPDLPVKGTCTYMPDRESFILSDQNGAMEISQEQLDTARYEAREQVVLATGKIVGPGMTPTCDCHPTQSHHNSNCPYIANIHLDSDA